jgi:hypothetical protein
MKLTQKLGLCVRILRAKPCNLYRHAERELPATGDEMHDSMSQDLREIVLVFGTQGHSGFSAGYARHALEKLLAFEPLLPLTGDDDEWVTLDYDGDMQAQNKRCSHVFKRRDGTAYDSEGIVFEDEDGSCFTSGGSRVDITFPYTPKRTYVKVQKGQA